jgi:hypothetical protein
MATIDISIRRDNGTQISASAEIEDTYVADIAMTLTALLFDSAAVPPVSPAPAVVQPAPAAPAVQAMASAPAPPGQRRSAV